MKNGTECTDSELVTQILNGEDPAFAILVARFHRKIYSIAYRMVGNATDAEDLSQEIFLRIYRNIASYDLNQPLGPWLARVACNHILNRLKRHTLRLVSLNEEKDEQEREIVDTRDNPEVAMISRSREARLQAAIMSLPENYRLAFTLKYVEDLTAEEIAEIMQIPKNTIKTWLVRAREALRSKLANEL